MAEVINMPKMSDTMTEGVIVSWLKKVGDDVKPGDILAEVETDKATMELENYIKGTLLHIGIPEGGSVPVDSLIAIVGAKGEDISGLLAGGSAPKAAAPVAEVAKEEPAVVANTPAPVSQADDSRVKASPLAKSIAKEKGIDLSKIAGSGDHGRIVRKDIENYTPAAKDGKSSAAIALPQIVASENYTEVPVSQMRKAIAARKQMNEFSEVKISVNDIIVKAVALSLRKNPNANSSWLGDKIRYNQHIHVGVAVAIEDGLIVPVVKFADNKSISHISAEVKQLAEKAKNKKLQPNEFEGNTFTISNLGMYGIDEFTAIINPPDACILAVGAAKETVVAVNGEMKIAQIMKVTLSCDHRVVDGAVGSSFLQTLKDLLENPVKMLV